MFSAKLKTLALDLFKIDAIKFGDYVTKLGIRTPVYVDLRVLVSHPKIMESLSTLIIEYMSKLQNFNVICGVPYTALPIASIVSIKSTIPMVMRRKEAKDYGTKKLIEGHFNENDNCLVIEDVVTSGISILETVTDLTSVGLKVTDVIFLLDRQQGGKSILEAKGIKMHALLTLTELMTYLCEASLINQETFDKVAKYIAETQVTADMLTVSDSANNRLKMPFELRAKHAKNSVAKRLFEIMVSKETNLCLAADLTKSDDVLNLAESLGPYICILKTHVDIIDDFNIKFVQRLKDIAKQHNFLVMEDRKFSDIGNTVHLQYTKGSYRISSWIDLVTVHSLTGSGVIDGLKQSDGLANRGVFVLAETSAAGNLITEPYVKATLKMATDNADFVTGIVCQNPLFLAQPGFVQLTPGVQLDAGGDDLGQQYNSPENVMLSKGADVAVVGRGIISAAKPVDAAIKYKEVLWKAYLKRVDN